MIRKLWDRVRFVPKRFYRYGTLGLTIVDDRTPLEKLCDNVDVWLDRLAILKKRKRHDKPIWKTYYDICSGTWITSSADIRRIEKERGWLCMKPSDIKIEADYAYKAKKEKSKKAAKEYLSKCAKEINQGRSFIKEQREAVKRSEHFGTVKSMNG